MKRIILGMGILVILMSSFSKAELTNSKSGVTAVKHTVSPASSTAVLFQVSEGERLMNKSDCMGCHNKVNKIIGPAYISIAQKYKPTEKNLNMLADRIIKGGTGVWGTMPMSAHPAMKKTDAVLMVKYILSVKK